jgi:hypothetical protein
MADALAADSISVSRGVMRLPAYWPAFDADGSDQDYVARVPVVLIKHVTGGIYRDRPMSTVTTHGAVVCTWATLEDVTEAIERYYEGGAA